MCILQTINVVLFEGPMYFVQKRYNDTNTPFCTKPSGDQTERKLVADSCHKADRSTTSHQYRSALSFCPECHHPEEKYETL